MNEQIKNQLKKVKTVHIDFDDSTTHILIHKVDKIEPSAMVPGKIYEIKIKDHIIHPPSNSTLASNWNGGKNPTVSDYYAEFISSMSNMYKFNCTAVGDPSNDFFGFIPSDGFEIVKEVI